MRITTITVAVVLGLSSSLAAAQAAHHSKKSRHLVARSMKAPKSAGVSSTDDRSSCRSMHGMGTDNEWGVDNDLNVYRDMRPRC